MPANCLPIVAAVAASLAGVIGGGLIVFLVLRAALGTIHVASYERGRRDERERVSYFAQIATYIQGDYGYHGPVYRVVIPVDPKASPIPSFIEAADAAREEQKGKTE